MRTTQKQLREERGAGETTIEEMRVDLAEREAMNMNVGEIIELILSGFEGLENMPDIEIRDEWNNLFGELDDNEQSN